jgi:iron complex outermembrane recepter protein
MQKFSVSLLVICCFPVTTMAAEVTTNDEPHTLETITVTARLRTEAAQAVPISMSVIGGAVLDATNTSNLSQLTQLAPSLNYSSPNPRNTALTIRGLGSSVVAVAQANDGLEPGVGFYVDQVYHARPATAAFDFLDLERVEILRGPQGTLFGKNTTGGAVNITTRKPSFARELRSEVTAGNYDYLQTRFSLNAPLIGNVLAGRISTITIDRGGILKNVVTGRRHNDMDNGAIRGQLLYQPTENFSMDISADYYTIDTNCCTQVYVRTGQTLRPAARQFPALAAGKNYTPASLNPFDRLTDIDADLRVMSDEGGLAATANWQLENMVFTSISAWRFWKWNAANDRDYTGLTIQTIQGIPSRQDQYSQEFRLSSTGANVIDYTAGLYVFTQTIKGRPVTAYGPEAAYWLLGPEPAIPGNLLEGYRTDGKTRFQSDSYAVFGELTWHLPHAFEFTGGLRYTREEKQGSFDSTVTGGLATTDPNLIRQKLSILRPQSYVADVADGSFSGRMTLAWKALPDVMPYMTFARGYKSGGINMSGLPLTSDNLPALATAVIEPEQNTTYELGMKSELFDSRMSVNADVFHTTVEDFQANIVDTGPGALRGYLANIDEVRVQGLEFDMVFALNERVSSWLSGAWLDGKYASYPNGPCPLEQIGASISMCNLSGKPLSSLPKVAASVGLQYSQPLQLGNIAGDLWFRIDYTIRDDTNGESSNSVYTELDGYELLNATVGFRMNDKWELTLWARNLLNEQYMQNLTVQAGNSGMIAGTTGDPRMVGITLRGNFQRD